VVEFKKRLDEQDELVSYCVNLVMTEACSRKCRGQWRKTVSNAAGSSRQRRRRDADNAMNLVLATGWGIG